MIDQVDMILQKGIDLNHFPGVSYAIIKKGCYEKHHYLGYKEVYDQKISLEDNVVYDVASLTKVIVTTPLILKLVELKRISLQTPIYQILTQFKHKNITVFDLLTHSSGLPADLSNAYMIKDKEEIEKRIYTLDCIYEKSKKIIYSDIGFILLGWVIETIYDMPLDLCAKKYIFEPLKMHDTTFHPDKDRCAPTELRNDSQFKGMLRGIVHDEKSFAMQGVSGHAGLFSTTRDIMKYMFAILNNSFVLNQNFTELMFKKQITHTSDTVSSIRALGWDKPSGLSSAGDFVSFEDTILHTGFTGCHMVIDQLHQMGWVFLSNSVHPSRAQNGIKGYRHEIGNVIMNHKEVLL